jgi:hypothetical protein
VKTVQNPEQIEKIRQEIMRFRELLDVMRTRLDLGDHLYAKLFAGLSDEEKDGKQEKALQTLAAYQLAADQKPLADAVLRMQFEAREFEKAFEELYGVIITPPLEE